MSKFLSICLNPVLQKTFVLKSLKENEVNRSTYHFLDASGKGVNVTRILKQLGEEVIHITQSGGRNKELFLEKLRKDDLIFRSPESKSEIRFCYTLLSKENSTTTEIVEEGEEVARETEEAIYRTFMELVDNFDMVILSGSKAKGFSQKIFPSIVRETKRRGKRVVLDVRRDDLLNSLDYRPDYIMPNLSEFLATFFTKDKLSEHLTDEDLLEKAEEKMIEIYHRYGSISVLTRGANETLYVHDGESGRLRPPQIKPVNTIGCGDAFTAGFASVVAKGGKLSEAVAKAQDCAAKNAVLLRPGVIYPDSRG